MVYKCETCKKIFKQKGHYQQHLLRKKPCEPKSDPKCAICNEVYEGFGNNPYPITDNGRCCDDCNSSKVVPARIHQHQMYQQITYFKKLQEECIGGEIHKCPFCKIDYKPRHSSKAEAFKNDDMDSREQWLSGCCGPECWDANVPNE